MNSSIPLGVLSIVAIFIQILITTTIAQEGCSQRAEYCWNCNSKVENYTSSTTFQKNLNILLNSISSDSRNAYGFYNSSLGTSSNRVNAIALCRGEISQEECRYCLMQTSYRLLEHCPNKKEAIIWDERCMVRYSNDYIFHKRQDVPLKSFSSPNSAADAEQFKKVLNPLLNGLVIKAASGNSTSMFAFGNDKVPGAEKIFALVQCTPDLKQDECRGCLQDSVSKIPYCCGGKQGGRVLKPSCNLRFESGLFYGVARPAVCSYDVKYCWGCTENDSSNTSTIFKQNLNTLLFSKLLPKTKIKEFGFYSSSVGEYPNRVNGLAMCRGDVEIHICHKCINESSQALLGQYCPDKMEAIIWAELCMVRYSNRFIFSLPEDEPVVRAPSLILVSDPNTFKQVLNPLLDRLTIEAASGDLRRMFSTGNVSVPGSQITIYGLTQCTPNIRKQQCVDCLQKAAKLLPVCCDGVIGARILKPSCSLRYEIHRFYN